MPEDGQERWWIIYKRPQDECWSMLTHGVNGLRKPGAFESFSMANRECIAQKRRFPEIRFVVVEKYHEITLDEQGLPFVASGDSQASGFDGRSEP